MRFIIGLFIILFSFSSAFALDDDMSFGLYGYGYIPMETDKNLIGYGGGGGFKLQYDLNKYFALGLEGDITASRNGTNSTTFGGVRFLLIAQNETEKDKNGFVPWGAFALGTLMGNGSYENGTFNYKNFSGFDISLMIGLRYNYKRAYFGIGADFTYGETIAEVQAAELYPNQDFFIIGTNIFLEAGYRF